MQTIFLNFNDPRKVGHPGIVPSSREPSKSWKNQISLVLLLGVGHLETFPLAYHCNAGVEKYCFVCRLKFQWGISRRLHSNRLTISARSITR